MEYEKTLELKNFEVLAKGVERNIKVAGVSGLDHEKAKSYGLFDRLGNLLALMSVTFSAANMVFKHIDALLTDFRVKQHEIKRACGDFNKAYAKFMNTWVFEGYFKREQEESFKMDTEELYHLLMKWGRLPEVWGLGGEQKLLKNDASIMHIDLSDRMLNLFTTTVSEETIEEPEERWCVTKFDVDTKYQETVYDDMTKADAQVVAKRLSAEDSKNIYTSSILRTKVEKIVEVIPMKAYRANEVEGDAKKQ